MLARSKLNSTYTIVSQTLIDSEINHQRYTTTINRGEKYRRLKEDKIGIIKIIRQNNESI